MDNWEQTNYLTQSSLIKTGMHLSAEAMAVDQPVLSLNRKFGRSGYLLHRMTGVARVRFPYLHLKQLKRSSEMDSIEFDHYFEGHLLSSKAVNYYS